MKTVTITQARRRLGAIVDAAGAGEVVRITGRSGHVYVCSLPPGVVRTAPTSSEHHRRTITRLRALWRTSMKRRGETVSRALRAVRASVSVEKKPASIPA